MRALVALICAAPMAVACSGPVVEGASVHALQATPSDGTTGVGLLAVDLSFTSGPPAPDLLAAVAASATFATWPDLTPIETLTTSASGTPQFKGPNASLSAASPVDDGWYAALFAAPPAMVALGAGTFHLLPDGRPVVRLHVGSLPMLTRVTVCPKPPSATAVLLQFSEAVHAATTSAGPLALAAGPMTAQLDCETDTPPVVERSQSTFEYVCRAALGAKDVISMSIGPGLISNAGVEVRAVQRVAAVDTLVPDGTGCSTLLIDPMP